MSLGRCDWCCDCSLFALPMLDKESLDDNQKVGGFLVVVVVERIFMEELHSRILCEVHCNERPVQILVEREEN